MSVTRSPRARVATSRVGDARGARVQRAKVKLTSFVSLAAMVTCCVLGAERLVPRLDRVGAGRQAASTNVPSGRWCRSTDDRARRRRRASSAWTSHLNGTITSRVAKRAVEADACDRRRHVEGLVDGAFGSDVVQQRVAVADGGGLADAHAEDARRVAALVLIEHHRRGRHRKAERAEPVLDVDEHVLQRLVLADDDAFFGPLRRAVFD